MMIKVLQNPGVQEVEFHPVYSVICSEGKAPFSGTIDVHYAPGQAILEFESFEAWLKTIALDSFTIESFTVFVFNTLKEALNPKFLRIKVNAVTQKHAPASAQMYTY